MIIAKIKSVNSGNSACPINGKCTISYSPLIKPHTYDSAPVNIVVMIIVVIVVIVPIVSAVSTSSSCFFSLTLFTGVNL